VVVIQNPGAGLVVLPTGVDLLWEKKEIIWWPREFFGAEPAERGRAAAAFCIQSEGLGARVY
jgi:hypothetical protein